MVVQDILAAISERFRATARVETVFGEPQTHHGRTVIPVAQVAYGFGAGAGQGPHQGNGEQATGSGGGGGGGVRVHPVGALIISEVDERFVPFRDWRRAVAPTLGAFFLGYLVGRRAGRL